MKTEKVVEALDALAQKIERRLYVPGIPKPACRLSPEKLTQLAHNVMWDERLQHYLFMCLEAKRMILEEPHRREKVMRWLGFIQGTLYERGVISIEDGKQLNKP